MHIQNTQMCLAKGIQIYTDKKTYRLATDKFITIGLWLHGIYYGDCVRK